MKKPINTLLGIALTAVLTLSACTETAEQRYAYQLGNVGSFAEIINAGAKDLALSSPMSPTEMDEFMPLAKEVAARHSVEVYREDDLVVTQLFPANVATGKEVLVLYQGHTLDTYQKLKADKVQANGDAEKELDISRRFGRLLSYTPRKINRLLAENTDYRTLDDFGIKATNVFLYYKDLPRATRFYKDVVGLELLTEYDNASVFIIANGAYLICVDAAKGMHSADEPKSVALAFLTDQLPEWYAHVQAQNVPIKYTYKPREGGPHDGFVAIDPEGYLLEFEEFKPHKENEPFATILANNPRTETSIEANGKKLSFFGAITWLYHKDVLGMQNFYEDVMGLELAADQGWTKIYRATDGGYIGLVDERRGMNDYSDEKAVTVSFFMEDLQGWYDYVKAHKPFELRSEELGAEPDGRYRAFVGYGPEKYFLEFDAFGEHADNVRLLQTLVED